MVELQKVGMIITLVMIVAGSMMSVIGQMEPGNSFGMSEDLNTGRTIGGTDFNALISTFQNDLGGFSSSAPQTQIIMGAQTIVVGAILLFEIIIGVFTGWIAIVDLMFIPFAGTNVVLFAIPIKLIIAFIMIITIVKFLGDIVRSLPFFGGR